MCGHSAHARTRAGEAEPCPAGPPAEGVPSESKAAVSGWVESGSSLPYVSWKCLLFKQIQIPNRHLVLSGDFEEEFALQSTDCRASPA